MPAVIPIDVLLVSQTRERVGNGTGKDFSAAAIAILRETSPRAGIPVPMTSPGRGEKASSSKKNLNAAKADDLKQAKKDEEVRVRVACARVCMCGCSFLLCCVCVCVLCMF